MKNLWHVTSLICCRLFINYENDNKWFEIYNHEIIFIFTFLKSANDDVILFDKIRKMYVRISNLILFYSLSEKKIDIDILYGKWIIYQTSNFFL